MLNGHGVVYTDVRHRCGEAGIRIGERVDQRFADAGLLLTDRFDEVQVAEVDDGLVSGTKQGGRILVFSHRVGLVDAGRDAGGVGDLGLEEQSQTLG